MAKELNEFESSFWLTTKDNPFNPFEDLEKWLIFDNRHNYNTCGMLDRHVKTSAAFSDAENIELIREAIGEIIAEDLRDLYRVVTPDSFDEFYQENFGTNKEVKEEED